MIVSTPYPTYTARNSVPAPVPAAPKRSGHEIQIEADEERLKVLCVWRANAAADGRRDWVDLYTVHIERARQRIADLRAKASQ